MTGSSRADDPMLVRTPDMGSLRSALAGRFTIGTHDICRSLQCSRTWFQKNVKPHLHYVFITTNGIRALRDYELADKAGEPCLDQCWYDEAEFRDFIDRHTVVSVNLFFTSFAKQARRSRKGGFTGRANVFSPIPVTA